jgi:hypothetical protein
MVRRFDDGDARSVFVSRDDSISFGVARNES